MIQKFISKLSEKERKILYLTAAMVLLALLDRVFLGPVTARLSSLDEEIHTRENSLKRNLRFLAYKDQIMKEKEALRRYYTKKQYTPEEIIAAFLKRIEVLSGDAKINLIKVTPSEGEEKKGYKEYHASLECNGKLKDVLSFLHMVDSSDELLKVVSFNMTAKKASPDEVTAVVTIVKIMVDPVFHQDTQTKESE